MKEHESEEKVEVVFPTLPPALVDLKESVPDSTTQFTVPAAVPQEKKPKSSHVARRKSKKSRRRSSCMYCEVVA
jgi:hypothetical protein